MKIGARVKPRFLASATALLVLAGCASVPTGPSVMVLPGSTKTFDQFRVDDLDCRQYASSQVGGTTADQAAENSGVKSAAVGAAVGAAAGAIMGGQRGAATGAGTGLIIGGATGAGAAGSSQRTLQQRYDNGYQQCMYAKGHKIPTAARYERSDYTNRPAPQQRSVPPPPPPSSTLQPPPPPAGTPPPPPPGVQ